MPPKRPKAPYIIFGMDYRAAHPASDNSLAAQQELTKRIGAAWKELSDAEKAVRTFTLHTLTISRSWL